MSIYETAKRFIKILHSFYIFDFTITEHSLGFCLKKYKCFVLIPYDSSELPVRMKKVELKPIKKFKQKKPHLSTTEGWGKLLNCCFWDFPDKVISDTGFLRLLADYLFDYA